MPERTRSPRLAGVRRVGRAALEALRHAPVTFAVIAVYVIGLVVADMTDADGNVNVIHLGLTTDPFSAFPWLQTLTALFVPDGVYGLIIAIVLALVCLIPAERWLGSPLLAAVLVLGGALANVIAVTLHSLLALVDDFWGQVTAYIYALDPAQGITVAIMTASAFAPIVWKRRIRFFATLAVVNMALFVGAPADAYRLVGLVTGLLLGVVLVRVLRPDLIAQQRLVRDERLAARERGLTPRRRFRMSYHEIRIMTATAVVMLALGPVVAVASQFRFGLLSPVVALVESSSGSLAASGCSLLTAPVECLDAIEVHAGHFVGSEAQPALLVLALLISAWALYRGRRFAVWVTSAILAAVAIGALLFFVITPALRGSFRREDFLTDPVERFAFTTQVLALIAFYLLAALGLVLLRFAFPVRVAPGAVRRFFLWVGGSFAALVVAYVVTVPLLREHFRGDLGLPNLLRAAIERFVPKAMRALGGGGDVHAETLLGRIVNVAPGFIWSLLLVVCLVMIYSQRAVRGFPITDRELRTSLREGASSTMSFMATWPGSLLWRDEVTGAIVPYRAESGIALTLAGPIGGAVAVTGAEITRQPEATASSREEDARTQTLIGVVNRFGRYARDHGLSPVWYSVDHEVFAPVRERLGWRELEVAEECIVDVQAWKTTGKKWQDVRSAISRAEREGVRAMVTRFAELDYSLASQLRELSEAWVAEKALPEMGFTLGGFDEARDDEVRLVLAVGPDDRLQAVLSFLPVYSGDRVIGATLDFMRRADASMNGVMEFLIATAAVAMKEEGLQFMSLSGAPLAHTTHAVPSADDADESPTLDRILAFVSRTLEPSYGFSSLHRFKLKFQPVLRPLVVMYEDPVQLPAIGVAVLRSYMPTMSVRDLGALTTTLNRKP